MKEDSKSAEFEQVSYFFKSCLPKGLHVRDIGIKAFEDGNKGLAYKYERKTTNMLKLAAWVNLGDKSWEEMRNYEFEFPEKGMEFNVGNIPRNLFNEKRNDNVFIYVEIAVGKAFVTDSVSDNTIPIGFDSLYLVPYPLERNKEGKFNIQEYQLSSIEQRDPRFRCIYFS